MVSKIDFCTDLLIEHFNPAGPINILSQKIKDKNRPFVKGKITQGFTKDYQGRVRVNLDGIVIASDNIKGECFAFECFQVNCFESTLEETNIPVSGICKQTVFKKLRTENGITTETLTFPNHPDLEPEVRTFPAKKGTVEKLTIESIEIRPVVYTGQNATEVCDLYNENQPIYYARGTKDIKGNLYFADFGYIEPLTKDFILIEKNVPFSFSAIDDTLTTISSEVIPREVKAVKIKTLNQGILKEVGLIYGQLEEEFYFPHQTIKFNRDFKNQDIVLEDLVINLLLLMGITTTNQVPNRIRYRDLNYAGPEVEAIIINSFQTLANLLNSDSNSEQYLSIPSTFKSYTKSDEEYNIEANDLYTSIDKNCFEDSCFEDSCFKSFKYDNLINRSIDNQAIAWTVCAFTSYIINYTETSYKDVVINLLKYLLNQKDLTGLYYRGWEDSLPKETYEDSLKLLPELDTSTNIAIFMALLKGFEVTQDFNYLLEASLLKDKITLHLINSFGTFKHSYTNSKESIESSIYSLIYINILKDYTKVNPIIKFLKSSISNPPPASVDQINNVIKDIDNVISETDNVVVERNPELDNFNQIFIKTPQDTYDSELEILKINYLAFSSINLLSNKFDITFSNKLEENLAKIENRVITKRGEASSLFATSCLINNQPFLTISNNDFNSLIDLNNFSFTKDLLFRKMLEALPTNYNWFDKKVINKNSNIGKLLYTAAVQEALNSTRKNFIKRMSSVFYMYGDILNSKALDLGLKREIKELDSNLKDKITLELTFVGNTKSDIESKTSFYNTEIVIKENYKLIQAFASEDTNPYINNWGEGFLSGKNKASNLLYTINVYQPLEEDVSAVINKIIPAGTKKKVNEVLSFTIGKTCGLELELRGKGSVQGCIGFRLKEEKLGCSNIDLENADNLARESGGKICLENEESVIEYTPSEEVDNCPGILTDTQDIIVTSDGNKICITNIGNL